MNSNKKVYYVYVENGKAVITEEAASIQKASVLRVSSSAHIRVWNAAPCAAVCRRTALKSAAPSASRALGSSSDIHRARPPRPRSP